MRMDKPLTESTADVTTDGGLCPHFGDCGGCESQDVPYPEQLEHKEAALRSLFAGHWDDAIPVTPSPVVWHYRNKVDFNFGLRQYPEPPPKDFERETLLGFTRKGEWYFPLDITDCRIAPRGVDKLLEAVREWYRGRGLRAYDSRGKEGFLRTLLVREGRRTGERMVALFTSPGDFDKEGFVQAVRSSYPAQSVYRGVYRGVARGTFADEMELLDGDPYIQELLQIPDGTGARELRFRVSPFSFFQTNSLGAEVLYGEIRRWVREVAPDILYDLYGGAGGIAFSCSDLVTTVRSVESEESATKDGEYNARQNGIENVFFTTEKMKHYLRQVVESGGMESSSAVVTDPPRGGMTPKPVKRLVQSRPPHIMYVSCKASVLAEELPKFLEVYDLTRLWAIDLFPHTPHVEVLATLRIR